MIDHHVHIERGPYSRDWLQRFVNVAQLRGIRELVILEHSHRFLDFKDIYESILTDNLHGDYQQEWFQKRCTLHLSEYKEFIETIRRKAFPVTIRFGLEICFFPDKVEAVKDLTAGFKWDTLTGSVHWIDGWGFDHPKTADTWGKKEINTIYQRYYEIMINLCHSRLFQVLAHPDSIKCFNHLPSCDLTSTYQDLAFALLINNMKAEVSSGLKINYQHSELGPGKELLQALILEGVELVTASDAHRPEDVGLHLAEAAQIIKSQGSPDKRSQL